MCNLPSRVALLATLFFLTPLTASAAIQHDLRHRAMLVSPLAPGLTATYTLPYYYYGWDDSLHMYVTLVADLSIVDTNAFCRGYSPYGTGPAIGIAVHVLFDHPIWNLAYFPENARTHFTGTQPNQMIPSKCYGVFEPIDAFYACN